MIDKLNWYDTGENDEYANNRINWRNDYKLQDTSFELAELHDKLDEVIDLLNKHDELLRVDNEIDNKKHVIDDDATREARVEGYKKGYIDAGIAQLQEQSGEPNE